MVEYALNLTVIICLLTTLLGKNFNKQKKYDSWRYFNTEQTYHDQDGRRGGHLVDLDHGEDLGHLSLAGASVEEPGKVEKSDGARELDTDSK